jgi:protein gp37
MSKAKFNKTNQNIGWAAWSWNPLTGCLGPKGDGVHCDYCYAKKMAERFHPGQDRFTPAFHPERLDAPQNTPVPKEGNTRVFVCSAGELFGPWVPDEWIDQIFEVVRAAPQWTFLFLTKWPGRLPGLDWPKNAWIGCTIDKQERVSPATDAFEALYPIKGKSKLFISCEPLLEDLDLYPELMGSLDWIIVGALSKGTAKVQPEPAWVENVLSIASDYGVPVWMKDNLIFRPQEVPRGDLKGFLENAIFTFC